MLAGTIQRSRMMRALSLRYSYKEVDFKRGRSKYWKKDKKKIFWKLSRAVDTIKSKCFAFIAKALEWCPKLLERDSQCTRKGRFRKNGKTVPPSKRKEKSEEVKNEKCGLNAKSICPVVGNRSLWIYLDPFHITHRIFILETYKIIFFAPLSFFSILKNAWLLPRPNQK